MANSSGFVGTQKVWQEWYEVTTGLHGRLMAVDLIGLTTSTGLTQVLVSTAGNLHVELQPSTEVVGLLGASTAAIGHVIIDTSTAIVGYVKIDQTTPGASNAITVTSTGGTVLLSSTNPGAIKAMASTESIGLVTLLVSTAKIGALQASTESVGLVTLLASTAAIGSLLASTAKIGGLQPSTEAIGLVTLQISTAEIGSLASGNNHVGQVGGNSAFPSAAIAVTTSGAYSSGDVMGSTMTFSNCFRSTSVMTGILQSVVVTDLSTAGQAAIDLWLFQTVTTGSTFTNDAAATIADADLTKIVAKVSISSGDYYQFSDNAAAVVSNLGLPIQATTGTGLTGIAICRSTAPSYATTSDLNIQLSILQD